MKNKSPIFYLGFLFLLYTNTSKTQDTPEFLIDTSIVFGYSYDVKGNQAIEFDGTNYLVVWEDYQQGNLNIVGTFVDQLGRVLNPHPNVINITKSESKNIELAKSIWFDFK